MKMIDLKFASAGLALILAATGCKGPEDTGPVRPPVTMGDIPTKANISADAGIPIQQVPDAGFTQTKQVASAMSFRARQDAFALMGAENAYEREQLTARLFGEVGNFQLLYQAPPPPPDEKQTYEPQPYRRVAGIILGDAVLALIEMEDGQVYDVRPGQQIPNSEWRVVSIDADKVILRRSGNKRPREISVRLESRPSGMPGYNNPGGTTGGTTGGGTGGGNDQGGAPPGDNSGAGQGENG